MHIANVKLTNVSLNKEYLCRLILKQKAVLSGKLSADTLCTVYLSSALDKFTCKLFRACLHCIQSLICFWSDLINRHKKCTDIPLWTGQQSRAKTAWPVQDFTSRCQHKHVTDDGAISGTHCHTNAAKHTVTHTHQQPNKTTHNKAIKQVISCIDILWVQHRNTKHEEAVYNNIRLYYVHWQETTEHEKQCCCLGSFRQNYFLTIYQNLTHIIIVSKSHLPPHHHKMKTRS